jgi:Bacteriophage head to tail connecting protein
MSHQNIDWLADDLTDEERANRIYYHAGDIETRHQDQHENNLLYSQLYYNRTLSAFDWGCSVIEGSLTPISRLSENLILNVADTFFNTITRSKAKAAIVLNDANFELQQQAKSLDRWLYAHLRADGYRVMEEMFIDACLFSFGACRIDVEKQGKKQKMCITRMFPDDVLVDQRECHADQEPAHVFHRRVLPMESAVAIYGIDPDMARQAASRPYLEYRDKRDGNIVILEVWRRAYYDFEGKLIPGRHCISTWNQLILDEPWEETWIPVVFFKWRATSSGWYCPSLAEEVLPYQIRLNEINETIRKAQDLMIRPRLLVAQGAKLNVNQIDNEIGKIISYTGGSKPEAVVWQGVGAELYGERDRVVKSCYEFMGVSQLAAQAKMPQGARFDSSLAIREFNTTHDQRWAKLAQRQEHTVVEISDLLIRVATKSKVKAEVTWSTNGPNARAKCICWDDIDLDRDQYMLSLEPASVLNETPSARKDMLADLLAKGIIDISQYAKMWGSPDLDRETSLYSAALEDIDRVIDLLLHGEYEQPSEFMPITDAIIRVQRQYLKLRATKGVPDSVFVGFEKWLLNAKALSDRMAPPPELEQPLPAAPSPAPVTPA